MCVFVGGPYIVASKLPSKYNKKFELTLTRCAKAYISSCSQTVSLSLVYFTFLLTFNPN